MSQISNEIKNTDLQQIQCLIQELNNKIDNLIILSETIINKNIKNIKDNKNNKNNKDTNNIKDNNISKYSDWQIYNDE